MPLSRTLRIGHMRVSEVDGSQVLDLQRDALATARVAATDIYEALHRAGRDPNMNDAAAVPKASW